MQETKGFFQMNPGNIIFAILFIVTASCVDDSGNRGHVDTDIQSDAGSGPVDCGQITGYHLDYIEDFELGAASGTWFANNDICEDCQDFTDRRNELLAQESYDTEMELLKKQVNLCRMECDDSQSPNIFDKPLPAERILEGNRCKSKYALHLETDELTEWGANLGNGFAKPNDVSSFVGLSFWARRSASSRGVIRVELSEKHTTPRYEENEGPLCTLTYTEDTLSSGCDRFGSYATVTTDWNFFTLPFDEMRQTGWGYQAPYFDTEAVYSITFLFPVGKWDIWIDDVAFYSRVN